jgi:hypothetical protein
MSLCPKQDSRRQTPRACGRNGKIAYENLTPEIDNLTVIENAERIVDVAMPQRLSTQYGGHYYSFVSREQLLNVLLFHYLSNGFFPTGSVCIVDKRQRDSVTVKHFGRSFNGLIWKPRDRPAEYLRVTWIKIPPLAGVVKAQVESDSARHAIQAIEKARVG